MARTQITPLPFGVVYVTDCLAPVGIEVIYARDYWAACKAVWAGLNCRGRSKRATASDFILIEDPAVIASGRQQIRLAAVAVLARHEAARKARA